MSLDERAAETGTQTGEQAGLKVEAGAVSGLSKSAGDERRKEVGDHLNEQRFNPHKIKIIETMIHYLKTNPTAFFEEVTKSGGEQIISVDDSDKQGDDVYILLDGNRLVSKKCPLFTSFLTFSITSRTNSKYSLHSFSEISMPPAYKSIFLFVLIALPMTSIESSERILDIFSIIIM
ncbi:MAG: hypothetical protein HYT97_04795 [Elusimicrobia bacterium]|nr:hypothetical protein [Elusimicrobiota bacterium]